MRPEISDFRRVGRGSVSGHLFRISGIRFTSRTSIDPSYWRNRTAKSGVCFSARMTASTLDVSRAVENLERRHTPSQVKGFPSGPR